VLLILGYGAPWATAKRTCPPSIPDCLTSHYPSTWFPDSDAQWADFVRSTVRQFGSDVSAFEVWNEPNNLGSPPCGGITSVRQVMVNHADGSKKIWGTEWGYAFHAASFPVLQQESSAIADTVRAWRSLSYAGPLFLYALRDPSDCAGQGQCWGLVSATGQPKQPEYDALSSALRFVRPECTGAAGAPIPPTTSVFLAGQCWQPIWGDVARSPDGRTRLILQTDGNLVLYLGSTALWASGTNSGVSLRSQSDGNLVLVNAAGNPVWASGTWNAGPSTLSLGNDANPARTHRDPRTESVVQPTAHHPERRNAAAGWRSNSGMARLSWASHGRDHVCHGPGNGSRSKLVGRDPTRLNGNGM
jgi:hypothetical protein